MDRDSRVGIATRYGLDDPGIEFRWGRYFPHLSRPGLGPTQPSVQWVRGFFPGGGGGIKRPGRDVNHAPPSNAEVKERVDPTLRAFMACSRVNFTVTDDRCINEYAALVG